MKAAIINQYGSSHEFKIQEVPTPEVDSHEVLIRVYAAGINPVDTKLREGAMKLMLPGSFPKILGAECAGVIEEVGLMVTDFQPGDRVVAGLGVTGAGYAELTATKQKNVVKLPDAIDFTQAAAMPVAAGTALQAMRDKGHLRPNDRVLINGASGGVGTFAVQIARIIGAHVTAVCSADNAELVKQLGAHVVVDYKSTDFTKLPDKFEVVFDAVGKSSFDACREILTDEGTYVTTTPSAKQLLEQVVTVFTKQKAESIVFSFTQEDMNWLLKQVADGRLVSVIDKTYSLDQVGQAHAYSETGRVKGKLVLAIG
ncbi:NAD(P)-dependent alcohol dehydrogenase [Fibrivirga algicola]|uniref:NAD(P)-dependent alcohol dehydrogenase n=1 Tax=Fibrivirga algicola TaxID=2950420 RepID=A0ABX0QJ94_9BACT|nr:NAD(P)-dependent alcohol dehydrogenase [Fibrivirga algicola]NID12147.1 NAD(P)-dependent alcohol dehydrogenase [Fibrivirga algicola]